MVQILLCSDFLLYLDIPKLYCMKPHIFNAKPTDKKRYFYVFANIDDIQTETNFLPVYEIPFEVENDMVDLVEDCFNDYIALKHVADMKLKYAGIYPDISVFKLLDKSVNKDILNINTVTIFTRVNSEIILPMQLTTV